MIVKTASGSTYIFTEKNGEMEFIQGRSSGKLLKPISPKVGEPLEFFYLPYLLYGNLSEEESWTKTTPVVSIT